MEAERFDRLVQSLSLAVARRRTLVGLFAGFLVHNQATSLGMAR